MVQVLIEYAWRHKQPGNRHGGRFPAFSAVRFSFDISSAWPFVEWLRWERGGNKYKSDFAFRLYRCHPFGQNVAERRDKKRKTRESDWTPFFFSFFVSLCFPRFFSDNVFGTVRLIGKEDDDQTEDIVSATFRKVLWDLPLVN